jgi:hypothetical protein
VAARPRNEASVRRMAALAVARRRNALGQEYVGVGAGAQERGRTSDAGCRGARAAWERVCGRWNGTARPGPMSPAMARRRRSCAARWRERHISGGAGAEPGRLGADGLNARGVQRQARLECGHREPARVRQVRSRGGE